MTTKVVKLYPHQQEFVLSRYPITCLRGGRACGKTHAAALLICLSLIHGKNVIFTAQTYKTLKIVLYAAIIKQFGEFGLHVEANSTEMIIKYNNNFAYGFSAESGSTDNIRGVTNCSLLVMDEAALATKEFFQIASACLRGEAVKKPQIFCISTPKGNRNWFTMLLNDKKLLAHNQIKVIHATTRDNKSLSENSIKMLENLYSGKFARQELEGEIIGDSTEDQVIDSTIVYRSASSQQPIASGLHILGVDIARFGDDKCVGISRWDKRINIEFVLEKSDTFAITHAITKIAKPNEMEVYVDGSGNQAGGVVDVLRKYDYFVHEIMFGGSSPKKCYANMRTYMYFNLLAALQQGVKIPDSSSEYGEKLIEELIAQRYTIDRMGRQALVNKQDIKSQLGRSPDFSDALALTCCDDNLFRQAIDNEITTNKEFEYELDDLLKSSDWSN